MTIVRTAMARGAAMIASLTLLASSAAAAMSAHDAAPGDPPEKISYHETGPEGAGRVRWDLLTGGQGQFESIGSTPESVVRFDFNVGVDGFRKINALLASLEAQREVKCTENALDLAVGVLAFDRGIRQVTIRLDRGCIAAPDETAFRAMDEANLIILGWVGTDKWGDLIVASPTIAPPRTANQPNCCAGRPRD